MTMINIPVILATNDMDVVNEVTNVNIALNEKLGDSVNLVFNYCNYLEEASTVASKLSSTNEKLPGIVIFDEKTKINKKMMGEANAEHALTYIESLEQNNSNIGFLLIAYSVDTEQMERLINTQTRFVSHMSVRREEDLSKAIEKLYRKINLSNQTAPDNVDAHIELFFHEDTVTFSVKYFVDNKEWTAHPEQRLSFEPNVMSQFIRDSDAIDKSACESWAKLGVLLKQIGKNSGGLFADGDFVAKYQEALNRAKDGVFFRIKTTPELFGSLYEAIQPSTHDSPITIKHPTVRTVNFNLAQEASLQWNPADPINILVVLANPNPEEDKVLQFYNEGPELEGPTVNLDVNEEKPEKVNLPELNYVSDEGNYFKQLRDQLNNTNERSSKITGCNDEALKVPIGKIKILTANDGNTELVEAIKSELTSYTNPADQFDIFHFVGHTYDPNPGEENSSINFVLPTSSKTKSEQLLGLKLRTLASWLKQSNIQLAYLSCCASVPPAGGTVSTSTTAGVAQVMAQNQIPVTLGFRWNVYDDQACKFAIGFYNNLFYKTKYFELAMQKTRSQIFDDFDGKNAMWAAPVLLYQSKHVK